MHASRRIAPTVLLCAAMLALSLVPRGLVLCVADAHVQIEGGCELAPCDTPGEAASARFGMEPADRCTDTPLLLPTLRKSSDLEACALPALAQAASTLPHAVSRPDAAPRLDAGAALGASLRSLRSVVLIV